MTAPFDYRRNLKQKAVDKEQPIDSGTLPAHNPQYKADPESWKNEFVARLKNNKLDQDTFDEEERFNVVGNVELFDGRPQFGTNADNNVATDFLTKYLQGNLVENDRKITQVTARQFVEQDPKQGLAGIYPEQGIATS
jgi:hypothetical protein